MVKREHVPKLSFTEFFNYDISHVQSVGFIMLI